MKKYGFILFILLLISCGSYNSIDSFYNTHKNDANVTAVQIPQFMLSLLRGSSDDMNSFMGNVRDIRYIQLNPKSELERTAISNQITGLVSNRFVEVFRKNEETMSTLVSVRENRDVVKEIIIYKNGAKNNSVFYLNGNFDPVKVRDFAKEDKFDTLSGSIIQQYRLNPVQSEN